MFRSMRSRTKLLLLTVVPLVVITSVSSMVYYWIGMNSLQQELTQYREQLVNRRHPHHQVSKS